MPNLGRYKQCISILVFIVVAALAGACAPETPPKPTVVIDSPLDGSRFIEGDTIGFQSTALDATGVTRIELLVDGTVVRTDTPPNPKGQRSFTVIQSWKAAAGAPTITVRAFNASGLVSDPARLTLTVAPARATKVVEQPTRTAIPTRVPEASSTPCSPNSTFVADITVPPGTPFAPGQGFNKIWRMRNDGTCTWDGYRLALVAGEGMTTVSSVPVPSTAPGATADVLIAMAASTTPGPHAGQWQLRGPGGLFGQGFNVNIRVVEMPPTPTGCTGSPVITSFDANPPAITAGQSSTLTWGKVDDATSATVDPGIGEIATPGRAVVSPTQTTTYTLTALGCGGTAARQVTVTVNPAGGGRIPGDSTPTVPPTASTGDVSIDEVFLSPGNEVIARISVSPRASVSGSAYWKVYANDVPVAENKISLPVASETFWSGYVVTGTQVIRVVVEIKDVNGANNEKKITCYALTHICQ